MKNLKTSIKQIFGDPLLLANFLSNLFYSVGYPQIYVTLTSSAGSRLLALNGIIKAGAGIFIPYFWNKYSKQMYKYFAAFNIIEIILYIIICGLIMGDLISPTFYFLADTFFTCIVGKNITCGVNRLKAVIYNDEDARTQYDNNTQLMTSSSSFLGLGICFVFSFNFSLSLILFTIGICIDNLFYINAWRKSKHK